MLEEERKKIIKAAYLHYHKISPTFRCTQQFHFVPSHLGLPPWVCNYSDGLPLCSLRRCGRSPPAMCWPCPPKTHGGRGNIHLLGHSCPGVTRLPPGNRRVGSCHEIGTEPLIIHVIWIVPSGSAGLRGNAGGRLRPPLRAAFRLLSMQLPPRIILPGYLLGVFISHSHAATTGQDQGINFLASKGYEKHCSHCSFSSQEVKALAGKPREAREGLLW